MKIYQMILLFAALAIAGCGERNGLKELNEARAAIEQGDATKAVRLLEKSLKFAPDNVNALVSFAEVNLKLGKLVEAENAIAKARESNRDDLDVRYLAAQIAWHLKKYDEARTYYQGIANDMKLPATERSRGWTGLGIVQMTNNEPHRSRVSFLTAIRLDRRNAAAWYHLGILYRESPFGYNEAALEQFNIYVRLDTEASPRVQKVQRTVIPGIKELIAREAMDRPGASKRNSGAASELVSAGETALKKGTFKTARQKFEEALKTDPLSYPAALGLARAIQKTDTSKTGQQKAFEAYRTACVLRPTAISTYLTTADLAVRLGMNAQAAEIYSRVVAANPSSIVALDGLIRSLRKLGKSKDAAAYQHYRDILK